ncbi:glutamate--tRNA ligase [Patescibacteria group bacterium]|nr:glutamate--tRNA ligase [Patescibacteria group bacterium]MBU1721803.1 glutamate--tRNA ligase [Patescibacteria group bacterium]MBU1900845.1 glutamate--tRNA ligase [Patescibacteria group bacterium]
MIKTRFAPSPTGFLHVGSLRTALYAYLYAKKHNGSFVLRVEDTDRARLVEGSIEAMVKSLAWGGIEIDEGVTLDPLGNTVQLGDHGPYIQSERLPIYKENMDVLLEKGHAYHCFCGKERLDEVRKMQELNKMPTGYDGHCRELSKEEVDAKIAAGESHVIRLKMPKEGVTKFTDMVRGEVEFKNELIDDQVLMKSDGFPTYHFAVVVDDHLMEITHVIRGEEWISSTPKHIMLYEMFGWEAPQFAHLSLLVNEQKAKLSKRHGDVAVEDFKEKGYLPEALVNFISFLGWNPGDDREIFSLAELEKEFDFDKVAKSAAVFNREKLAWYNKQYIKGMSNIDFARHSLPYLKNAGLVGDDVDMEWLESVVALEKERMEVFTELPESLGYIFATELEYDPELIIWKKATKEESKEKLEFLYEFLKNFAFWKQEVLEDEMKKWIQNNNFGVGDVLWPMRTALSGRKNSPSPFEIAGVLGQEETLKRIKKGIEGLV